MIHKYQSYPILQRKNYHGKAVNLIKVGYGNYGRYYTKWVEAYTNNYLPWEMELQLRNQTEHLTEVNHKNVNYVAIRNGLLEDWYRLDTGAKVIRTQLNAQLNHKYADTMNKAINA